MKTKKEVEQLKREWEKNPSWDLEETEGFEEYHDELARFAHMVSMEREVERLEIGAREREMFGCTDRLLQRIKHMESRLTSLEKRVQ